MRTRPFAVFLTTTVLLTVVVLAFLEGNHRAYETGRSLAEEQIWYPNTYSSVHEFMEGIYVADHHVTLPVSSTTIRGLVIPHHLAVSGSIAAGVKLLSGQSFKRILLISPDHFHQCETLLCTVNSRYQTFFGEVAADPVLVRKLRSSPFVSENKKLFETEHGIFADVPFIAHYFPGISVTPLVISQKLPWKADRQALLDFLYQVTSEDTMVILSSDFSHYLPLAQADLMDQKTEEALTVRDLEQLADLRNPDQSDCPNGLWLLTTLMMSRETPVPTIVRHTNSARILDEERLRETTSHYVVLWSRDPISSILWRP